MVKNIFQLKALRGMLKVLTKSALKVKLNLTSFEMSFLFAVGTNMHKQNVKKQVGNMLVSNVKN